MTKITFETYSHFWGVVLLLWLMGGGVGTLARMAVKAYHETVAEVKKKYGNG